MQKQLSTQAAAAKAIRAELKAAFPTVKFSVRSDSFAGGDAVRISWTDGPMTKEVDAIVGKYQYGHFDGMQDLYENSNRRNDIPQTKYVQTSRSKSEEVRQQIARELNIEEGADLNSGYCENRREYYSTLIHREFSRRSFVEQSGHPKSETAEAAAEAPAVQPENESPAVEYTYEHKLTLRKSTAAIVSEGVSVYNSYSGYKLAMQLFDLSGDIEVRESFYLLLLNSAQRPIGWAKLSEGGTNGTVVDIKHALAHAILCNATGVIAFHNHPSGSLRPSEADFKCTKKMKEAFALVDINMLDHIIVTPASHFSFADEGLI